MGLSNVDERGDGDSDSLRSLDDVARPASLQIDLSGEREKLVTQKQADTLARLNQLTNAVLKGNFVPDNQTSIFLFS